MNLNQRLTLWLMLITMMLGGACFWAYQKLETQKRLATVEAKNQDKCQQIAQAIDEIRQKAQTMEPADEMSSLVQHIQSAASQAGMPMQHVQRIRPSSARRIGQSPYVQKPTQLSLQDVTLKNAVSFLHQLSSTQADMQIKSLRMTAPRLQQGVIANATTSETWNMEVGLASIAYVPQVSKPEMNDR
ncbi:MAG: hypothetical protein ACF8OB_16550 [Phycisphaeraceae bacterium JB051]